MSIWGKLGGAAAGMLVGGPLGAVFGALAGHVLVDREGEGGEAGEPGVAFTIAIIALSAKMAMADGVVTQDEIDAFDRMFDVPPGERVHVRRVFDFARQDTAGYESYARQIANMFKHTPALLEDVLDGLFRIASADGIYHPGELAFLTRVSEIFGFSPDVFARIQAAHFGPDAADPYVILGVARQAGQDEVKQTYRLLVRQHHPDALIARGVPAELVALANDKLAAINTAYARVARDRGWR